MWCRFNKNYWLSHKRRNLLEKYIFFRSTPEPVLTSVGSEYDVNMRMRTSLRQFRFPASMASRGVCEIWQPYSECIGINIPRNHTGYVISKVTQFCAYLRFVTTPKLGSSWHPVHTDHQNIPV